MNQNQKTRNLSLGVEVNKKSLAQAEQDLRRLLGPEALARFEQAQAREALARAKRAEESLKREREAAAKRTNEQLRREWDSRLKLEVAQGKHSEEYYKLYLRRQEQNEELSYRRRLQARREYLQLERAEETRARRAQAQSFGGRVNTLVRSTRFGSGGGIMPLVGRTADVLGPSGLAGGLAVGALTSLIPLVDRLTKSASDLNESVSKSQVVFGTSAKSIEAWGETSAKAFGLSKQAAIEQASTLGNLLRGAGIAQAQSAEESKRIVQLAADLASFNNVAGGTDEVLADLRSALVGESEPVRKYGILLSETAVKAEALRIGLVKASGDTSKVGQAQRAAAIAQAEYSAAVKRYGESSIEAQKKLTTLEKAQGAIEKATKGTVPALTEQQKVMARLSLLFEQTKTAQGDFARTAGEAANSQRILNAELKDLEAKLGEKLLPLRKEFLQFLISGAEKGLELADSLNKIVGEIARLDAAGQRDQLPVWIQNLLDASETIRLNLRTAAQESTAQGRTAQKIDDAATVRDTLAFIKRYPGASYDTGQFRPLFAKYSADPFAGGDFASPRALELLLATIQKQADEEVRKAVRESPAVTERNRVSSSYMMGLGELAKNRGVTLPSITPVGVKPGSGKPTPPLLLDGSEAEKAAREAKRKREEREREVERIADEIADLTNKAVETTLKANIAAAEAATEEAQKRVENAIENGAKAEEFQKLVEALDAKNALALLARQKVVNQEYEQALNPQKGDTEAIKAKRKEAAEATLKAQTDELIRAESKYIAERKELVEKAAKERQERFNNDAAAEAGTQDNLQRARQEQAQAEIEAGRKLSALAVRRAREAEAALRDRGTIDQRRGAAGEVLFATTKALEEQLLAAFTAGDIAQVAETLDALVQAQKDYTETLRSLDEAAREELARLQSNTDRASQTNRARRRASARDTYTFDGKAYSVRTNEEVDPVSIDAINQLQQGATQAANTFLRNIVMGKGSTGDLWKELGQVFGDAAGDFLTKKLITGPLEKFFDELAAKFFAGQVAGGTGSAATGVAAAGGLRLGAGGSALLRGAGYAGLGIWGINQLFGKRSPFKGLKLFASGGTAYSGDFAGMGELGPELTLMRGRAAMVGEGGPAIGRISERMRIIDAKTTAQIMASLGQGEGRETGRQVVVSGPIMQVDTIHDRGDADYAANRVLDLLMNRMEARGY